MTPRPAPNGPRLVLLAVWLTLFAAALAYVVRFGPRTPYWDQWGVVVLVLTGEQPVTPAWLWEQHNEHRLPIAKLAETAVVWVTGGDFRAGMVLNALLLGASALAVALAVGRIRGRLVVGDVFFPLLLLGWGQCETLLRGDVVGNVLTTALVCVVLLVVARTAAGPRPRDALLAAACLLLLPLCGAAGLPWVPPLALWLAWAAFAADAWPRRARLGVGALCAAGAALLAAYLVGFERPALHPREAGILATLRTAAEFLAMSLGTAAAPLWLWACPAIVAILTADAVLLGLAWRRSPGERTRILGFVAALAALGLLALEVGLGRSGFGPGAGLAGRYATLAAPALVHAYVVWDLYGPRAQVAAGRAALVALLVLLVPANVLTAVGHGQGRRALADPFERDLRAGLPADVLGQLYASTIFPDPVLMAARIEGLRRAGVRGFERVGGPAGASEPLTMAPVFVNQMTWSEGTGRATGEDPYVVFALDQPRFVYAVRLRYAYPEAGADASAAMEFFWRRTGVNDFVAAARTVTLAVPASPAGNTVSVPIRDTIDQLRVDPDARLGAFRLLEGTLLLGP